MELSISPPAYVLPPHPFQASFQSFIKAHPGSLPLYFIITATQGALLDFETVCLLPHGLRAALHAAQQQQVDTQQAAKMVNSAVIALQHGWQWLMTGLGTQLTHEQEADPAAPHNRALAAWLQQGLVDDLRRASQRGCQMALHTLMKITGCFEASSRPAPPELQRAVADCMLDPQHARMVVSELARASEALGEPRPGPGVEAVQLEQLQQRVGAVGLEAAKFVAALRMSRHRRGEVLAGPIGRELRRLARYHKDGRIMAGLMGRSTPHVMMLASAVTSAAALCGELSAEGERQLKEMMF